MKRRHFITSTIGSTIALSLAPKFVLAKNPDISYDELIGKGNPDLYGASHKLRYDAHNAFLDMKNDAAKSGIAIYVVSSYRNYDHQKRIWERKYQANMANGLTPQESIKKIIAYSTIPGTSRHHWGTDIDIVDGNFLKTPNLLSAAHFEQGKPFYELGIWLKSHASNYGFHEVYTNDPKRKGFKFEPWHYSYKPLSCEYLQQYQQLNILAILQSERFLGSEHFSRKFMDTYITQNILDINSELLP